MRLAVAFALAAAILLLAAGALARPGRPPEPPRATRVEHVVCPGDTLDKIAKEYGVTAADLRRWNRLVGTTIYVGHSLTVHTLQPVRPKRETEVVVQPGDTLGAIAEKHAVRVEELQAWNKLPNPNAIRAGQTLRLLQDGPEKASEAKGKAQGGKLINGEQMPPSSAWHLLLNERTAWGTNETVSQLQAALRRLHNAKAVKKLRRKVPPLVVGDLSRKGGGPLPPHVSHQNGRDVDLGYFHQGEPPTSFVKASKSNLDFELTWALLMALTEKGAVDYIFIDRNLQKWLHDWALEQKKAPKAKLDALFQHPDGGPNALVRHEPGHLNHMHVRFRCPATDPSCY